MSALTNETLPGINQTPQTTPITPFGTSPTSECLGPDFLNALPVELLLSIADFLLLEDIYCLSFCNRRLLAIFWSRTKHQYHEGKKVKLAFLRRLERDSPQYLTCSICAILHAVDGTSEPFEISSAEHTYPPRVDCPVGTPGSDIFDSVWMDLQNHLGPSSRYKLHFSHLVLAMRQFYYGPQYGISTDALSFTEVTNEFVDGFKVLAPTALFSIEAQICPTPPGLHLRIQEITSLENPRKLFAEEDYLQPGDDYGANLPICKHRSETFWMMAIPRGIYPALESSTCEHCNTDYEIQTVMDPPNDRIAIVTTRWINLGAGLSPDDLLWRLNANPPCSWGNPEHELEPPDLEWEIVDWSPRCTFEAIENTSLGDLTARNLSYIQDQRYETEMVPNPLSNSPSWALWNGAWS
ncbi:hypothetical protein ACN38_g5613 [Penicillium nordicum]|uniref:F-box domain-containing protein n=1 Tax=Penicillium nordicum TaxID=229535 RepID=A0A0M9WG28_9EURO|nr:hypothetical protein ACN38_g5613 [Penicillium nordicum]